MGGIIINAFSRHLTSENRCIVPITEKRRPAKWISTGRRNIKVTKRCFLIESGWSLISHPLYPLEISYRFDNSLEIIFDIPTYFASQTPHITAFQPCGISLFSFILLLCFMWHTSPAFSWHPSCGRYPCSHRWTLLPILASVVPYGVLSYKLDLVLGIRIWKLRALWHPDLLSSCSRYRNRFVLVTIL